jgi:hypothetical protein
MTFRSFLNRRDEALFVIQLANKIRRSRLPCAAIKPIPYGLRLARNEAENGTVRRRVRFTALAMAMLVICLSGTAQYHYQYYRPLPKTAEDLPDPEDRIDINHASMNQLLKAHGMTRSWAGRIVRFRPYHTKLDLMERGVVTSQVYNRIKDYVIAHREKQ